MTYCLGILLKQGLVLAADSRTNAGVDQIALVRKLAFFTQPDSRMLALASAGNLATTQAVTTLLRQRLDSGGAGDLFTAGTMFDAARIIGDTLREVLDHDGEHVNPHGDPTGSFLLAGQLKGGQHRLFQIYPAGNFIEASPETPFLQIGETKYGKPILDRLVDHELDLPGASKCALISMDATMRSNLSVAPPIDLLCYQAGSLKPETYQRLDGRDPYFRRLTTTYSRGLGRLFDRLADPPWLE